MSQSSGMTWAKGEVTSSGCRVNGSLHSDIMPPHDSCSLILQVGTPRTGSTTMQAHIFPRSRGLFGVFKQPYQPWLNAYTPSAPDVESSSTEISIPSLLARLQACEDRERCPAGVDNSDYFNVTFAAALLTARITRASYSDHAASHLRLRQASYQVLRKCLASIRAQALALGHSTPSLLAAEGLSNARFPTRSKINSRYEDGGLPVDFIVKAWKSLHRKSDCSVLISVCLRDPVPHLVSRYLRCMESRLASGLEIMSLEDYIALHVAMHRRRPFASALFPLMHKEFVVYHQSLGHVCAYGFRDLLRSQDVFSLMGIAGQDVIAFSSLPRENQARIALEDKKDLELRAVELLDGQGYLSRIMDNQLFE